MSFNLNELSQLPVSIGVLFFCKLVFLAALLGFVYYVARSVMVSLKEAERQGSHNWQHQHSELLCSSEKEGGAVAALNLSPASRSDSASFCAEMTVSQKPERRTGKLGTSKNVLTGLPRDSAGDSATCSSLPAILETSGFIEGVSGAAGKVKRYPIEKSDIVFGRARDCTVRIRDAFASSHHARVWADKDGVYLEDLHSRNGTLFNGSRIDGSIALEDGDVFSVGDAVFRYSRF
ncbi:FHA domain-containing protein [bacterium]|nr:FHA domain-containing protein [bacterium]